MTITSGSFTVGVAGTYATWNAAIGDIDAAGLSGDLTFTQISDVIDTAQIGATILINGFTLLLDSNNPPLGDVNAGWLWDPTGVVMRIIGVGTGIIEARNLRITGIAVADFQSGSASSVKISVHDIIVHGDATPFNQIVLSVVADIGGLDFYNCLSVNQNFHIAQQVIQVTINDPTAPIRVFNNVAAPFGVTNQGILITPANQVFTDTFISNNIAALGGIQDGFVYFNGADASLLASMCNNATTDFTTLLGTTSAVQGFDRAVEFGSIDFTDSNYLIPRTTSQFALAGSAISNPTTVDAKGLAYGANPPIGAYVATAGAMPNIGLFFRILQHLWPRSLAFDTTQKSKLFVKFNEGLSLIGNQIKTFIDNVYDDLFPQLTRELTAWETQWNLTANNALTEQQRRDRLAGAWKALGGQSPKYIQDTLQAAGFDVYIHEWWQLPVVGSPVARDPNAILAGDSDLLVNIITFSQKAYITGLNETIMQAGEVQALAGQFTDFIFNEVTYNIPPDPVLWPYFLYIGASVFPNRATVPLARKEEFRELCLKICPSQQWIGLLVNFP